MRLTVADLLSRLRLDSASFQDSIGIFMVLDEIGNYLQTNGIGTLGSTLFVGTLPDTPDALVGLMEYGGVGPVHALGGGDAKYERPRVQVVARATTYSAARTKIEAVYKLLHKVTNTTLSSVRYLMIEAVQSPFFLEKDGNNRVKLAVNFQVHKELSP